MDLLVRMATFVRVVEAGSFSAAAKQLRVSVAAVSRHVGALEEELGTSLVARTTRKLAVTPAGRLYYERCTGVLREVEEAQAVGRLGVAGPVRLSVPVSLGTFAADTLVYSLLEEHPDVSLDLRVEDRIVDLALENVDVAIRVGAAPPLSTELVAVPLATWTRVMVAAPAYLRRREAPKVPADLSGHEILSTAAVTDVWTLTDETSTTRVRLAMRFSTNAGHLLHGAALRGRGIALLPDWFVADDVRARRLRRVLPGWSSARTTMHALYRASLRNEQRVRAVVDHLRRAFAGGRWSSPLT